MRTKYRKRTGKGRAELHPSHRRTDGDGRRTDRHGNADTHADVRTDIEMQTDRQTDGHRRADSNDEQTKGTNEHGQRNRRDTRRRRRTLVQAADGGTARGTQPSPAHLEQRDLDDGGRRKNLVVRVPYLHHAERGPSADKEVALVKVFKARIENALASARILAVCVVQRRTRPVPTHRDDIDEERQAAVKKDERTYVSTRRNIRG